MKKLFLNLCLIFLILIPLYVFGGATFTVPKTWITGENLTSTSINSNFNTIKDNLVFSGIDDCSSTILSMRLTKDPYNNKVVLPKNLEDEIKNLRHIIKEIAGQTYWYNLPNTNLSSLSSSTKARGFTYKNLIIKNNPVYSTSKIDITADYLDVASNDGIIKRIDNINETIDIAISSIGGLAYNDIENINKTYAVQIIYDSVNNVVNGILTSNFVDYRNNKYDYTRIVGVVRNNFDKQFIKFYQNNNKLLFLNPSDDTRVLLNGTALTFTNIDISTYIGSASMCKTVILGSVLSCSYSGGYTSDAIIRSPYPNVGSGGKYVGAARAFSAFATAKNVSEVYIDIRPNPVPWVQYRVTTGSGALTVYVNGYILEL